MPATKKKAAASSKKIAATPDALTLLRKDHDDVLALLDQFENATGAKRAKLLEQIDLMLTVHMRIEEEIFYPAYRDAAKKKEDKKLYFEAVQEHHVADLVLPETREGENPDELKAKAKVFKEIVKHHIEEEQKEMFPRARKLFDRDELRDLGEMLQQRKDELFMF